MLKGFFIALNFHGFSTISYAGDSRKKVVCMTSKMENAAICWRRLSTIIAMLPIIIFQDCY